MTLVAGSRVGPYEIVAPLGAGGMGEVYRAHDVVLELVDGATLAERIESEALRSNDSGLPLDEALGIAVQIADAIEAAHEKGVV